MDSILTYLMQRGNAAKRNIRGILSDPGGVLSQWGEQTAEDMAAPFQMPPGPEQVNKLVGGVLGMAPLGIMSYVGGNTVKMTPQEFLDLAVPFGDRGGPKVDLEKVARLAKISKWDTKPMLSVKQGDNGLLQVGLHDGRHRALAAIKRGDKTIDVEIVRGKRLARENPLLTDEDIAKQVTQQGLLSENGDILIKSQF